MSEAATCRYDSLTFGEPGDSHKFSKCSTFQTITMVIEWDQQADISLVTRRLIIQRLSIVCSQEITA